MRQEVEPKVKMLPLYFAFIKNETPLRDDQTTVHT